MNHIDATDADEIEKDNDPNANCPPDPKTECSIPVMGGWLVFPAFPADCEYVRVVDTRNYERGYWFYTEWAEDPQVVMGALGGLLNELQDEASIRTGDSRDANHFRKIRRKKDTQ